MQDKEFNQQNNYTVLQECVLFNDVSEEHLEELHGNFYIEKWPRQTCLVHCEKFLFHFYIIKNGRVKMYHTDFESAKEHTIFLLKNGDVFDLFCLLDGIKHKAYYECLDHTEVLAIPMDKLRNWLQSYPEYYKNFLSYAGRSMRMLEENVSQLVFSDITTRLLHLLLKNIDRTSNKLTNINDLPDKELAFLIGSSRAVVNRHLQKMKKMGLIKISRNKLQVKNVSLLVQQLENNRINKN
ncbi:CRP/FNR family transcriptional regulator [Gramella sp. Hel_I_59]|uniref:Crp/Fnr family transcriptional regulator n=1 Tax=Gramella sp. Hel_I_59 TaxID=1249978 RepID=UPI001153507C|nr:Crp/Fnr family transcriptional regulator [Gramella sp. Hel_I_59]TQI70842.1 CRP/FNR family transcriptional regulator [Gramella sp. Hel_I_59]